MQTEKNGKISDIKDTASSAIEIIRELGKPGMQETLDKLVQAVKTAKEITDNLKTTEFVKNIENIRLVTDNLRDSSTKTENMLHEIKSTGIFDEVKKIISSASNTISSFDANKAGNSANTYGEISNTVKEMFQSVKGLFDELRMIVVYSKESGSVNDINQVIRGYTK